MKYNIYLLKYNSYETNIEIQVVFSRIRKAALNIQVSLFGKNFKINEFSQKLVGCIQFLFTISKNLDVILKHSSILNCVHVKIRMHTIDKYCVNGEQGWSPYVFLTMKREDLGTSVKKKSGDGLDG